MIKRAFCLILVVALTLAITACGAGVTSATSSTPTGGSTAAETTTEVSGPPVELTVAFPIFFPEPAELKLIQDEVNKITLEKINATVKLVPYNGGGYSQQMNLMLTGNEPLDLFMSGNIPGLVDFPGQVSKNQLTDLTTLLDQYGQGIIDAQGEAYATAGKVNGKVYAVPILLDKAATRGVNFRADYVDKYSIDMKSFDAIPTREQAMDAVEAVMKKVHASEPNIFYALIKGSTAVDTFGLAYGGDTLGDGIGVLENNQDLTVSNYFESPTYSQIVNRAWKWYQAGYLLPDAATIQLTATELIKGGKIYGWSGVNSPVAESLMTQGAGTPIKSALMSPIIATTTTTTAWMWAIPSYSKNAEAAMKFLNLLYTDEQVFNLLAWGIEGKHYTKNPDGTVVYPEGINPGNSGYFFPMSFLWGNSYLGYLFVGSDLNQWDNMKAFNASAAKSKAMGFIFDPTPVKDEFTAVTNVLQQYQGSLETGSVDPAKVLPEFIAALKSNGIDAIITEKQKQLDAWAAANGVK